MIDWEEVKRLRELWDTQQEELKVTEIAMGVAQTNCREARRRRNETAELFHKTLFPDGME